MGVIDISFRNAASDATFALTSNSIEFGASIRRRPGQTPNAGNLLDQSSEKAVCPAVIESADRGLEVHFARIRRFRDVNISVDAGAVHSFKVTHCLLLNSFHLKQRIFLDVQESHDHTARSRASARNRGARRGLRPFGRIPKPSSTYVHSRSLVCLDDPSDSVTPPHSGIAEAT
jgi:hypothetical protein